MLEKKKSAFVWSANRTMAGLCVFKVIDIFYLTVGQPKHSIQVVALILMLPTEGCY